jgi:transcription antitermination protein NusB
MNPRRHARECAVQLLFQLDYGRDELTGVFATFWADKELTAAMRKFAEGLVRGVLEKQETIDALIQKCADNWKLSRIARVDLSVLRLAVYELKFRPDVPPAVAINEAIDLAKYFSSNESGRFVNGVLDRARKELTSKGAPRAQ